MIVRPSSEVMLENNTIIQVVRPSIKEITLEVAKNLTEEVMEVCGDKEYALIFDSNEIVYANTEARFFYRNAHLLQNIKAIAIVAKNETAKLVARVIFYTKKNSIPVEAFYNKADAQAWIESLSLVH